MSAPEDSEVSISEDSEMSSSEDSEMSISQDSDNSVQEDSKFKCFCGWPAKLRLSHTMANPDRLFYNCSKSYNQCGFFQWADEPDLTGNRHVDELNLIRFECIRLQGKVNEIEQKQNDDRIAWEREKSELISKFSTVQTELNEIKKRIKVANESDLMPPVDKLWSSANDEEDNVIEIHAI